MATCFEVCAILRHHGTIDDREYFHNAICHFRGYRHGDCSGEKLLDDSLRAIDPVGSSFREMAVKTEYHYLEDEETDYFETLFENACKGSLADVQTDLQTIKTKSLPIPLQPLATVAAERGFPDILRFCLSEGAVFDADLDMAALYTAKTPGMLEVLMAHNWRNIAVSESARRDTGCAPGSESPQRPPMPDPPGPKYTNCLTAQQIEDKFGDIER